MKMTYISKYFKLMKAMHSSIVVELSDPRGSLSPAIPPMAIKNANNANISIPTIINEVRQLMQWLAVAIMY